jgi:Polyphosphate kinase 2 (PPK2)
VKNLGKLARPYRVEDAVGKDSTIKHVMSGVNPQGCQVYSFKVPSEEELNHLSVADQPVMALISGAPGVAGKELLRARPKRLRFLIFNTAGRLVYHARRVVPRLASSLAQIASW